MNKIIKSLGCIILMLVIGITAEESGFIRHIRVKHDVGSEYMLEYSYYDSLNANGPNTTDGDGPVGAPPANYGSGRPGKATHTHSCTHVQGVPSYLRSTTQMGPRGLGYFYQKYTHAYNIPVMGSQRIPDDALKRACYIVRFLLADNKGARQSYYRLYGRFALMAANEVTTNIPEYTDLGGFWDTRARGLGATTYRPVSSGAEENILCYKNDRYREEDIGLHEFAHGVHLLGLAYSVSGFNGRVKQLYNYARSRGTWTGTYAMSTDHEYFAEGVQSYFGVNAHRNYPDGIHGPISTRSALAQKDPSLYALVKSVFSCGNTYLKRCESTRAKEQAQKFKLDCQDGGGFIEGGGTDDGDDDDDDDGDNGVCTDGHENCQYWKDNNFCSDTQHTDFMKLNCKKSCNHCKDEEDDDDKGKMCTDGHQNCQYWKDNNYCADTEHTDFMKLNCKKSCNHCKDEEDDDDDDDDDDDNKGKICKDEADCCLTLVARGFCSKYEKFMSDQCKKSCNKCPVPTTKKPVTVKPVGNCKDENRHCGSWAAGGECQKNPGYMNESCKKSCNVC